MVEVFVGGVVLMVCMSLGWVVSFFGVIRLMCIGVLWLMSLFSCVVSVLWLSVDLGRLKLMWLVFGEML